MRSALTLVLLLTVLSPTLAQTAAPVVGSAGPARAGIEPKIERIQIEDSGTRIDELRVGGETKSIVVEPKGQLPAYKVDPASGERSWKVLGF
jgi:hypothetical protein